MMTTLTLLSLCQDLDESCSRRYLSALTAAQQRARTRSPQCPFITHQLLQETVDDVNADVQAEQTSTWRQMSCRVGISSTSYA